MPLHQRWFGAKILPADQKFVTQQFCSPAQNNAAAYAHYYPGRPGTVPRYQRRPVQSECGSTVARLSIKSGYVLFCIENDADIAVNEATGLLPGWGMTLPLSAETRVC